MATTLVIADDHELFRQSLEVALAATAGLEVVGSASDFREALDRARELRPDVMLLDIAMPGRGVDDSIRDLVLLKPAPKVLLVSGRPEDAHAARCLRLGAAGFVRKTAGLEVLIAAVRRVASGRRYVSAALTDLLIDLPRDSEPHESLSSREHQVMLLLTSGRSISEIADELCLSAKTVSTYRRRLLDKLSLSNNQQLTAYAFRSGLMDNPPV